MAVWYYYNEQGDKVTVTGKELKELARSGKITPGTMVETEDGKIAPAKKVQGLKFADKVQPEDTLHALRQEKLQAIEQAVQEDKIFGLAPLPSEPVPIPSVAAPVPLVKIMPLECTSAIKTINTYFMAFWICTVPFFPALLLVDVLPGGYYHSTDIPLAIIIIGLFVLIASIGSMVGIVFGCMLLYQSWKQIPSDIARTTPGRAVGFSFIPLFNCYWVFVAYKGVGTDINRTLRQCEISYKVNEGLGLTYCILFILFWALCWLPIINSLLFISQGIVLIFFLRSVKNGAVALLQQDSNKIEMEEKEAERQNCRNQLLYRYKVYKMRERLASAFYSILLFIALLLFGFFIIPPFFNTIISTTGIIASITGLPPLFAFIVVIFIIATLIKLLTIIWSK